MSELFQFCAKSALIALILFQSVILLLRFPTCGSKAELIWFLLILIFLGLHNLLQVIPAHGFTSFALLWAFGSYLALIADEKRFWLWHWSLLAVTLVIVALRILRFYGTLPFSLFLIFSFELIAGYPLKLLWNCYRRLRSRLFFFLFIAAALLFLSMGYDLLYQAAGLPPLYATFWISFLYLAGTWYMLAQENYLMGIGWQALHSRLGLQEKRLKSAYSRIVQTENTLLLQDRLIASGLVAAGAAHEFKNTLSSIITSADFGLVRGEADVKDQSLKLILEHAELGKKAILEFLDKFVYRGREAEELIRLKEGLKFLLDMVRATYHREGVRIIVELDKDLCISARKGELEQVLLNLIRNSVDSLKKKIDSEERIIRIRGWGWEDSIVLDVSDNGGGVDQELGNLIFSYSVSDKNSTGLGLYLAKTLVARNGGQLEYIPVEGGSCFRLIFPKIEDQ